MAGDTDNPRIWLDADVYVAPVGSTQPTNIATAWAAAWEPLGLLAEDGMTETREDNVTEHPGWGVGIIRVVRSRHKRTIRVTALEDNPVVWALVNPGSPTPTSASGVTTRIIKAPTSEPKAFGIEMVDGDITLRRVIPRGEVSAVGDVVYSETEMARRELTITIYPDADGVLYKDITDDPQAVES